ncbi:MAG: hypothetical protein IJK42_09360 [Prevotella sp.]|nr:hypothetical protein [Prevotella sp.]MBQ6209963.1 hypothetical protein [Prevotella sp.]
MKYLDKTTVMIIHEIGWKHAFLHLSAPSILGGIGHLTFFGRQLSTTDATSIPRRWGFYERRMPQKKC